MTSPLSTFVPTQTAPTIDKTHGAAQLLVDGAPLYVRGVELHNSTSSSPETLADGFAVAHSVHANVVLASVTWADVEPSEGAFDLSSVERIITQAREADTQLVLLWFGAWKNGVSSYAPGWVKRDWSRFARCVLDDGTLTDTLTPFGSTDLDLAAFTALLQFIEDFDATTRTVLMVQIENEIGLLGASRDHGAHATAAFDSLVPAQLHDAISTRPGFETAAMGLTWAQVSDDPLGRDEAFMAWGYASHVQKLAAAGREVSSLPFFVNAWLDSDIDLEIPGFTVAGGQKPGTYPSGGPLPRVADVWTTVATDIDIFAPDVYFGDTKTIYSAFLRMSGGLFIPEQRLGADGVGAAFLAWGEYAAIGVAPFGVDSRTADELADLRDGYRILRDISSYLSAPTGDRRPTRGFHLTDDQPTARITVGDIHVFVERASAFGMDSAGTHGFGLIVDMGDDGLLFAGRGFHAVFDATDTTLQVAFETVDEISDAGPRRRLNGDETASGKRLVHPPRERAISVFPIPMGHDHTGISAVKVYTFPRRIA